MLVWLVILCEAIWVSWCYSFPPQSKDKLGKKNNNCDLPTNTSEC